MKPWVRRAARPGRKRCGGCAQKAQCTSSPLKYLAIHIHEPARQRARELVNTAAFVEAQRKRKKVEALFAELKNQIGLRRLRLRRLKFVREQFFLAAAAQNIKRLVRFLSHGPHPALGDSLVSSSQETLQRCGTHTHQLPIPHSPFSTATVDFAIEHNDETAVFTGHRLGSAVGKVDDRKPSMPEAAMPVRAPPGT